MDTVGIVFKREIQWLNWIYVMKIAWDINRLNQNGIPLRYVGFNFQQSIHSAQLHLGISIGSYELGDPSLLTLKDGPLDEVRRRNEPKLNQKARILKEMVLNLIRQNKQVRNK